RRADFLGVDRVAAGVAQPVFALLQTVLDDFGSGFSSIGYLRQFGFDRIKIDRSLVSAIGINSSGDTGQWPGRFQRTSAST
ncbi:EAL domain-containing protein, partial [Rhizobium ruizarguesonis]